MSLSVIFSLPLTLSSLSRLLRPSVLLGQASSPSQLPVKLSLSHFKATLGFNTCLCCMFKCSTACLEPRTCCLIWECANMHGHRVKVFAAVRANTLSCDAHMRYSRLQRRDQETKSLFQIKLSWLSLFVCFHVCCWCNPSVFYMCRSCWTIDVHTHSSVNYRRLRLRRYFCKVTCRHLCKPEQRKSVQVTQNLNVQFNCQFKTWLFWIEDQVSLCYSENTHTHKAFTRVTEGISE